MASPAWREALRQELARQGLPPGYVERLVQELCDHFDDTKEENMSMDDSLAAERVGKPDALAAAAGTEYHERVFARKHPVLVFALLPLLLFPLLWVVLVLALSLAANLIYGCMADTNLSPEQLLGVSCAETAGMLILAACLCVFFGRFVRKHRIDGRWAWLTTGILTVFAGASFWTVKPLAPGREPQLLFCLGLPVTLQQLLQSALILAVGCWCCRRGYPTEAAR